MTQTPSFAALEGRAVRLMIGNTPLPAEVLEVSGLALKLKVTAAVPPVPRVRVELVDVDAPLDSLQLQGMVTQRSADEVTVTLERLMVAAGEEQVDKILAAWFVAVPRRDDCYKPMMRGYGYELRRAILSGRALGDAPPAPPAPAQVRPPRPPRSSEELSTETLDGFPPVAVRAGRSMASVTLPKTPAPPLPVSAPPAPKPAPAKPALPPRRGLAPQVARTGERLLASTSAIQMAVDCSTEGAGYGRGVVYRIAEGGRLIFVAARGVRPNFGARVELITDLEQSGISVTVRIAASVTWQAQDPDYPPVTLMAVRLAPTNQPAHLHSWDTCCDLARRDTLQSGGGMSLVPPRAVIATIET